MGGPIVAVEAADCHTCAFVGGVDELAVANIDAHVRDATAVGVREEDKVAGLQVGAADVHSSVVLPGSAVAEVDAGPSVDVFSET